MMLTTRTSVVSVGNHRGSEMKSDSNRVVECNPEGSSKVNGLLGIGQWSDRLTKCSLFG